MNLAQTLLNLGKGGVNVARGMVHAPAQIATGLAYTPKAIYRELQGKPIDDIQQRVFGTTDPNSIARQIIGNTAQTGLMAAVPAYKGASVLQGAKLGAGLGAAGGVASGFADDSDLREIVNRGFTGGALGGLIGGATPLGRALWLNKAKPFEITTGIDASFGPPSRLNIKAGVPLHSNPLASKGFQVVDNNPQPFKIVDNSLPRQLSGAAQQAKLSAAERRMVQDYFSMQPPIKGSALAGEGARLPSRLTPAQRSQLMKQMQRK